MDGLKGLVNYTTGLDALRTVFALNVITGNVDGPGNLILKELAPIDMPVDIPEEAVTATEQLPLVAELVNSLDMSLQNCHFWGMDEWFQDGKEVPITHPLSFAKADMELCFNRIRPELRMPAENIHFPRADNLKQYTESFNQVRCATMQGG